MTTLHIIGMILDRAMGQSPGMLMKFAFLVV